MCPFTVTCIFYDAKWLECAQVMESQTKILEPLRYHTFSLCVEHEVSKQESPVTSSTDEVEEGI